ncbi:MAG: hypothetical protein CFE36_09720 [Sphingomonadaceae bacterium PASS1]|nr:MAG: hypothetical protein CFE36_09720 [Sphingomonadaceae bacterium PASS1]
MEDEKISYRAVAVTGTFLTIVYLLLYQLNASIIGTFETNGIAVLVFLPAFARLLGYLLIGLWAAPFLFLGAVLSLDLGLDLRDQITVAALVEVGAPAALMLIQKARLDRPPLRYLTGRQLLVLSSVAALGSAITYHIGLALAGLEVYSVQSFATTVFGNAAGAWAVMYAAKIVMTVMGKAWSALR